MLMTKRFINELEYYLKLVAFYTESQAHTLSHWNIALEPRLQ